MTNSKSNLGAALIELLENRKWTAADIHRQTELQQSLLSRLIRGQQTFVKPKDLALIAGCFLQDRKGNKTPTDAARIIAAHCMDECVGPGSELVKIGVVHPGGRVLDLSTPLSEPLERALREIRVKLKGENRGFEDMLMFLANRH